ncbi:hypothetical protein DM02DRAFT_607236 [Periconia macrospinosa]|uniref:C2H2-type domain-containing protein n=1 Tax=Periconia macrospinosa TaxID=97972 RepID=A0A2V1CY30_9PLEO|nr:hypothetical protein DM02DRAFT_607236 [Periconia macrospinosa]
MSDYTPLPITLYPSSSSPSYYSPYEQQAPSLGQATTSPVPGISSNQPQQPSGVKPDICNMQCWEHGCNGRQFSTFSNLIRHQREKSGTAAKSICPRCGAKFTRTTARNWHMAHERCRPKKRERSER